MNLSHGDRSFPDYLTKDGLPPEVSTTAIATISKTSQKAPEPHPRSVCGQNAADLLRPSQPFRKKLVHWAKRRDTRIERNFEESMSEINQLYNAAEQLKDDGKFQEAIDRLVELLAREPNHVLSHLALAVLYGKVGRHEDAVTHGRKACEIDPSDAFNFTAMSVTYQRAWQGTQNSQYIQLAEEAMARAHAIH